MTVREERDVRSPPAMVLAALGTAGENLGWTVRDIRVREGLLIMTSGASLRGASLGFIVTARARRQDKGAHLSIDATPLIGSWARKSADRVLQDLVQEYQLIMSAPQARIRRPVRTTPDAPPFGALPPVLGVAWVLFTAVVYGLLVGGWGWVAVGAAALGAGLLLAPRTERWWSVTLTVTTLASLPFGILGAVARRMGRTNALWEGSRIT